MANTYKGILTNNGKALIANATVNNKINYSHIAVGDGNGSVPTPSETRPNLINEKARIALNVVEINPNNTNQIVCEAIIPTTIGGFYIRELGLYAGTTMVVNASYPPTYKPLADEGGAREIAIKIVLNIQNAEVIALYLDDSLIFATREWVNTNYIRRNEIVDNLTTDAANNPLSAKQGKYLQDYKLKRAVRIPDNADLNSYQSQGSYFVDLDLSAQTIKNSPTKLSFTLQVDVTAGVIQRLTTYNGAGTQQFIRSYYVEWSGWQKIYSELNPQPTVDSIDNLTSSDAKRPLSANQGRLLNVTKLDKATEQDAITTDKAFLDKYASRNTPSFFFDAGTGKFFSQFTVGISSSLNSGAYFVVGASPIDNKVKAMTGVKRDNGTYDLQKNLTLLDSESNNVVNGDFVWDNHKLGGWARGLVYKAKTDSSIYSGFGAYGGTDTVERVYFGFGGDNLWAQGNGKGIWIDQYKAFTNCNWEFSGSVSGSFFGTFDGSIQAKDIRNVSPLQIQGGKMGYYFAEYSGLRYGTATGATYGDFLALNGYPDSSGGKVNGLFFDKTSHQIYHFQNGFGTNNWGTPRQIAYTDSQIFTGTNKFTEDIQVSGAIYAQKFRGESDFWFTSNDEGTAKRVLTGGLLVSDGYSDANKIPNLGIYSKGHIQTAGLFSSTNDEVQISHAQTGRYLFLNGNRWGCYSAAEGDIPLGISSGGTNSSTVAGAKTNLQLNKFVQDPSVTSMYAPTTDSRIVITDNSWGVWSVNPNFNTALSTAHGGTGNTQGIAPSANKLQTSRRINNAYFDGTGDIDITAARRFHGQIAIKNLHLATSDGVYEVVGDGSILGLYDYGNLDVNVTASVIHQTYYAHNDSLNGSVAVRQSWAGPGNFTPWRVLDSHVAEISPIPYAGDTVPNGYIAMMGQAISQSSYPILYSVYGAYLLDLRGEFIRGWDAGRNVDFNRGIRSFQQDAIRNIVGEVGGGSADHGSGVFAYSRLSPNGQTGDNAKQTIYSFDASRVVPTASENRPRNIALNYIVRAI